MIKWMKLIELCKKITDGSHFSPLATVDGFPMLSVKDMRENNFSYFDCKFISEKDFLSLVKADCKPLKNDILIAKDGSYLKHVFVIEVEKEEVVLSSIGILRPNLELVNPYYIKYYLHSDFVKKEVAKKYVSGSALPRIIIKNFGEIQVPYVEKNKQDKIVNILWCLDCKIELNNRINAELEAMAKTLYDYWFVQFDYPDAKGKPYKTSGGKMVWNEELKREIPEGWACLELSKIISRISTGLNPRKNFVLGNGSNYYVTIRNIDNGKIFLDDKCDKIDDKALIKINKRSDLRIGDILFTSIEPVGITYLIQDKPENWNINESVFTLRPNYDLITSEFAYLMLSAKEIKAFTKNVSAGSIHKGVRIGVLNTFKVAYGNKNIISEFSKIIQPVLNRINILNKENHKLSELRDWLLPMLMNGQVRVG